MVHSPEDIPACDSLQDGHRSGYSEVNRRKNAEGGREGEVRPSHQAVEQQQTGPV